jgi:hypothetical protein
MALIVPLPPPGVARIRFVTTEGSLKSRLIRMQTKAAVSHAECVVDKANGGTIVSAQADSGVQNRLIDYDTWSTVQIFADLTMTPKQYYRWIQFLWNHVGKPFDHAAFFGFALPFFDAHEEGAMYCASFVVASLRYCGYFPRTLSLRYHQISPVILLMLLQAQPIERAIVSDKLGG